MERCVALRTMVTANMCNITTTGIKAKGGPWRLRAEAGPSQLVAIVTAGRPPQMDVSDVNWCSVTRIVIAQNDRVRSWQVEYFYGYC